MRLYNTLTHRKEEFQPAGDVVTIYVCGITTSGYFHLGHALSSVTFDVLHRYLEYRGYQVKRVMNFTDVDDKSIARAEEEGLTNEEVGEKYIQAFFEDADALNLKRADVYPRATEEIDCIIGLVRGLEEKGLAYEAQGSVYFRVRGDSDYGKLSRRTVDELLEGTRFEVELGKEDPPDFALWKASKPGEPAWDSPWGKGRPGWHIECSAMAIHHLDETIDIHGGGLDLVFPHHENEVAQSESFTEKVPFARFWMHNGLLRFAGDKMSKSLGNLVNVRETLNRHSADAVRLWMLGAHYRSPLLYDEEAIEGQERAARRLRTAATAESPGAQAALDPAPFEADFVEAMEDDLNSPKALASLFDLARDINRNRDAGTNVSGAQATLARLAGVLGLTLTEPETAADGPSDAEIELLIEKRTAMRAEKRFAEADAVRDELAAAGVMLADSPEGTTWQRT